MSTQGLERDSGRGELHAVIREHFRIVEDGDFEAMSDNVTEDFVNIRSAEEPASARQPGPAGLRATSEWLRRTFADLHFEIHDILINEDRAAVRVTMHGRQHGSFLVYENEAGSITEAFPTTGRSMAVHQTHWFRLRDGRITEHDAVRDDLGMAKQLKWVPPSPAYLIRMLICRLREQRRQR